MSHVYSKSEAASETMVEILEKFCNDNNLPHQDASELIMSKQLTDFQFGFLIAYCRIWDAMDL
jgi:hypothetical protein